MQEKKGKANFTAAEKSKFYQQKSDNMSESQYVNLAFNDEPI